jgi:hypothetical protein
MKNEKRRMKNVAFDIPHSTFAYFLSVGEGLVAGALGADPLAAGLSVVDDGGEAVSPLPVDPPFEPDAPFRA